MTSTHEEQAVDRIDDLVAAHPRLFAERPFEIPGPYLPAGWYAIAHAMCTDLEVTLGDAAPRFRPSQAKEKLGAWRFYWRLEPGPGEAEDARTSSLEADIGGAQPQVAPEPGVEVSPTPAGFRLSILPAGELRQAVRARVRQAEQETERTCMWCGEPGKFWTTGWIHVACERHRRPSAVTLEKFRRRMDERRREAATKERDNDGER